MPRAETTASLHEQREPRVLRHAVREPGRRRRDALLLEQDVREVLVGEALDDLGVGQQHERAQLLAGLCERHLVEPRVRPDRRKRRILHRGEVEAGISDLSQEHRHRDLLEPAGQMPGHVVVVFHRILLGPREGVGSLTSILIVSILSNIQTRHSRETGSCNSI